MTKRIRLLLISISCFLVFYVVIGGVLGQGNSSTEKTYRDLGVYTEVLSRIKTDYVTEPNLKKVTGGAIRGLLEALDPYSTYFPPQEFQEYLAHPNPGPADVGIFLSKKMGFATVVSVLPGSPAEKAGIKAGDLIDRVESSSARELSVVQIKRMLAGPVGTSVAVAVVKEAQGEPQKITLQRVIPDYPAVVGKIVEDNAAYVRVATFNKGMAEEISSKLKELTASHADKVVLDLRNCAGGEVHEAIQTASLFLDKGLITYAQGQRYPRQDFPAQPEGTVIKLPLVVLINQSTAGPAELVASAVLGNHRGEVVGVRSFGEGVVQKTIPVGDGSGLLLSVAKYYSLDGKAINDHGVTPSVVEMAGSETTSVDDENSTQEPANFGDKDDRQLRKALDILKQKNAPAKAA
ncbi:MAG TPA: S41 family peptidase [Terriglobia bacterium]|nr:S41 family peptidase [Terriglobia bacterium]